MLVTPNIESSPSFDAQAAPDSTDWQAALLAGQDTGVVSGCLISPHTGSDMQVTVAVGTVVVAGTRFSVSSASALVAAASSFDRKDLVIYTPGLGLETSGSGTTHSGAITGTPCATVGWTRASSGFPPVKPAIPAGSVLLAEVYVAASTTVIAAGNLIDKTAIVGAPYAPLASPTFTGKVTTPALQVTTSPTTGYVLTSDASGNAIWAVAPGGGGGAPLNSPAFTGTPTAPTAPLNTSTTQLATTAFVLANATGTIGSNYLALAGGTMTGPANLIGGPGVFNVRSYGATGNGQASGIDDTVAIQTAILACANYEAAGNMTNGGGIVYFPPGTYNFGSPTTASPAGWPSNAHQQLLYYPSQIWMGAGEGQITTLRCTADLGTIPGFTAGQQPNNSTTPDTWSGYAAIDSAATPAHGFACVFQDLAITFGGTGPTVSSAQAKAGNRTTGIRLDTGCRMIRCLVQRWFVGVAIWADHQMMQDCFITGNYYNLDFPDFGPGGGNQSFYHVNLSGAIGASIHVGEGNPISTCEFTGVHMGASPVGLFHTAKMSGWDGNTNPTYATNVGTQSGMMNDSVLNGVYFEGVCNAGVLDIAGNDVQTFKGVDWHHTGFSWGTAQKTTIGAMAVSPAPAPAAWTFYSVNAIQNFQIYAGDKPPLAGTIGTYYCNGGLPDLIMSKSTFNASYSGGFGNGGGLGGGVFGSGTTFTTSSGGSAHDTNGVYFVAQVCAAVGGATINPGDLVEVNPGSYTSVQRAGGVNPVFGVAMTGVPAGAPSGTSVLVQVGGTDAEVNFTGTMTSGVLVSTSNTVAPSTPWLMSEASANSGAPVIGMTTQPGGSPLSWVQLRLT